MLDLLTSGNVPRWLRGCCAAVVALAAMHGAPGAFGQAEGGVPEAAPSEQQEPQDAAESESPGAQTPPAEPALEGPPLPSPEPALPTLQEVEQRLSALPVDPEARTPEQRALAQHLQSARTALRAIEESQTQRAAFEQAAATAPNRLENVRADSEKALQEAELPAGVREAPLAEAEAQLQAARSQLDVEKRQQTIVSQDEQRRRERRDAIPAEIAQLQEQLQDISDELSDPPPTDESPAVSSTHRLALTTERAAAQAKIAELKAELRSYNQRSELLQARKTLAERRIRQAQQLVSKLEALVNAKRAAQAEAARRAAEQASKEAQSQHPVLAQIAEQNSEFAESTATTTEQTIDVTAELREVTSDVARLRRDFENLRVRADRELNEAIGLRLRTLRTQLPDVRELTRRIRQRNQEINRVFLRLSELEQLRDTLEVNRQDVAQRLLAEQGVRPGDESFEPLLARTSNALAEQASSYLDPLIEAYEVYEQKLQDVNEQAIAKRDLVERLQTFIDERILWVQSARPIGVNDLPQSVDALQWLTSPARWASMVTALGRDFRSNWPVIVLALLVVAIIRWQRTRYLRLLKETGEAARSMFKAKLSHTLAGLGLTVLVCLPTPLIVLLLAWRLDAIASDVAFATAMAPAARVIVAPLFVVLFLWHLCRSGGLAEAHFRWRGPSLRLTRRLLRIAAPIGLPLLFIMTVLDNQSVVTHNTSLGRFVFMALMALMTYVVWRLLSPHRGIMKHWVDERPNGWLSRLRYVWFPALLAIPIVLALAAAVGYFYTAVQLEQRVVFTVRLIVALAVVYALLQRWLYLAQRRVAIEQATKQQEAAQKLDATTETPPVDPQTIDVAAMSSQTMKLLRSMAFFAVLVGVLAIWSDVFPAFGMLREVTLWSDGPAAAAADSSAPLDVLTPGDTTGGADGTGAEPPADPAAETAAAPAEPQDGSRITLADLVYALFILAITVIISRDVPGLLEFVVLQRLPITYGARYAISTVTRYTLVIIGVVLAFDAIGIGWSKVQFLAAAITVGLGFGLQEIFANFVSGLIILFERPIRIGDTVTVGNISGTVSRIRMRATTITDWDRKELIIPNKEFVTGQIVNWTLSDAILRVIVPVGIAYGSDTAKAKEILLRVAQENEIVLDDPPPRALFLGFGDSSLNFDIRVFIPSIEYFLQTRDALHEAIDREFRKAGVEIAFPQRDLHLRSVSSAVFTQAQGKALEKPTE